MNTQLTITQHNIKTEFPAERISYSQKDRTIRIASATYNLLSITKNRPLTFARVERLIWSHYDGIANGEVKANGTYSEKAI